MKFVGTSIALALFAVAANAHTFLSSVNGNQGAVRRFASFPRNFPLWDIASKDMTCGRGAESKASSSVTAAPGSSLQLLWGHDNPGDDIIAQSHYGPCQFYMAKASEINTAGFFKIFEMKYNTATKQWCTDFLISTKGVINIPIPSGLAPGDYVLRSEVIALHEAETAWKTSNGDNGRGAQLYIFCSDITVTGTGNQVAVTKVAIPGTNWVASQSTPGILFNIYQDSSAFANYPTVGPAITTFTTDTTAPSPTSSPNTSPTSTSSPSASPFVASSPGPITSINPDTSVVPVPMPPGVAPLPPPAASTAPSSAPVSVEYVKVWQAASTFGAELRVSANQAAVTLSTVSFTFPNAQVITGVALASGRYDGSNLIFTFLNSNNYLSVVDATTYFQIEGTYNSINDGPSTASIVVNGQTYTVSVSRRSQLDATGELPKSRPANFGAATTSDARPAFVLSSTAVCAAVFTGFLIM